MEIKYTQKTPRLVVDVPAAGNATESHELYFEGYHVRVDHYPGIYSFTSLTSIQVGVGEVRHYSTKSRTPLAEHGMLHATSSYKIRHDPTSIVGSAIPGNELVGHKFRINAVAPKSRTVVSIDNLKDQYIQCTNVVDYLIARACQIKDTKGHHHDLTFDNWDNLAKGY